MKAPEINIDLFRAEYQKIEEKMISIKEIPRLNRRDYDEFAGLYFDSEGVFCKLERDISIIGSEILYFHVKWEELNEPLDYFKIKYAKEIEYAFTQKALNEKVLEDEREKKELEDYLRMKEKFENNKELKEKYDAKLGCINNK